MATKAIIYLLILFIGYVFCFVDPFWGIATYIFMNFVRPEVVSYNALLPYNLPLVTAILIIIASIIKYKPGSLSRVVFSPIIISLLLMVFCMWLSGLNAIDPKTSNRYTLEIFKFIIISILIVMLTDTEKKLHYFLIVNLIGGGFLTIWAFEQHFRGNERLELVGGGTTSTSNGIATLFVLIFPIFVHLIGSKNIFIRIFALVASLATVADIVFTQSRSAFFALFIQVIALLWQYKSKYKYYFIASLIPIFIYSASTTFIGETSYFDRINSTVNEGMDVDTSASNRKLLWKIALITFSENPFIGVGQQNFKYVVIDKDLYDGKEGPTDAHNTLLLLLCEGGLFTITFYLIALDLFFIKLQRIKFLIKSKDNYYYYNLALAFQVGMVGFLISSLAHSFVVFEYYYYLISFPLILEFVLITRIKNEPLAK